MADRWRVVRGKATPTLPSPSEEGGNFLGGVFLAFGVREGRAVRREEGAWGYDTAGTDVLARGVA
jgi:hypothetical protein